MTKTRRRKKRTSKRSIEAKLRRNMFVIVVVLLLAGWGIAAAVTWNGFHAQRVQVVGTKKVDPNLIRQTAHITPSKNIWLINPWRLAERLNAIPYVLSVDLQRTLPNKVTLSVHERRPDSCVQWIGGKVTIDTTQRVLESTCHQAMTYQLPKLKSARVGTSISDATLARLRADVAIMNTQHIALRSAGLDRDDGLVMVTRDGVMLLFGEDSTLSQTSALLHPIFAGVKKQGREVSQVDLRAASTPVVRYKDSSNQTEKSHGGA